jgi:hypothetical protein
MPRITVLPDVMVDRRCRTVNPLPIFKLGRGQTALGNAFSFHSHTLVILIAPQKTSRKGRKCKRQPQFKAVAEMG